MNGEDQDRQTFRKGSIQTDHLIRLLITISEIADTEKTFGQSISKRPLKPHQNWNAIQREGIRDKAHHQQPRKTRQKSVHGPPSRTLLTMNKNQGSTIGYSRSSVDSQQMQTIDSEAE